MINVDKYIRQTGRFLLSLTFPLSCFAMLACSNSQNITTKRPLAATFTTLVAHKIRLPSLPISTLKYFAPTMVAIESTVFPDCVRLDHTQTLYRDLVLNGMSAALLRNYSAGNSDSEGIFRECITQWGRPRLVM